MKRRTKILLTGGTGLIGSQLLSAIASNKFDITVISRKKNLDIPGVKWIQADLGTIQLNEIQKYDKPDILIHNAACILNGTTNEERIALQKVNSDFSCKLFTWATNIDVQKIIFTSSFSVLQKPLPERIDESSIPAPNNPYSISKYYSERFLQELCQKKGIQYFILRVSSPIPESFNLLPDTVVRKWISCGIHKTPLTVFGKGQRTQDFVAVSDIVSGFLCCISNKSATGVFNIASGTSVSMQMLALLIHNYFHNGIIYTGTDINENDRWNISIDRAKTVLGYKPRYTAEETILNLISRIL